MWVFPAISHIEKSRHELHNIQFWFGAGSTIRCIHGEYGYDVFNGDTQHCVLYNTETDKLYVHDGLTTFEEAKALRDKMNGVEPEPEPEPEPKIQQVKNQYIEMLNANIKLARATKEFCRELGLVDVVVQTPFLITENGAPLYYIHPFKQQWVTDRGDADVVSKLNEWIEEYKDDKH